MAFGFGAGSDMMKAYQDNKNRLSERKSLKELSKTFNEKEKKLFFREMSKEELENFKIELAERKRKERMISVLVMILAIIAVFGLFYFIFF